MNLLVARAPRAPFRTVATCATALAALAAQGCATTNHIRPFVERHRVYEVGPYEEAAHAASSGSTWPDRSRGLFADFRAAQVGDLVTIVIDENPRATGEGTTNTERSASYTMGVDGLFGLTEALASAYPGLDPTQLLGLVSDSSFTGGGTTGRSSRLRASVAVRVRQVLPNGDLFVEGTKFLMVNSEELHIYLSGVVRPPDIREDNTVSSSRIADAQIEFTGRGDLTDAQRQGWLAQILNEIAPF